MSGGYKLSSGYAHQKAINTVTAVKPVRKKMATHPIRNWIRNYFVNFDNDRELRPSLEVDSDVPTLQSNGMRFQVYKASGGFVIETTSYDRRKDERTNNIYIVNENDDLGNKIGQILTMESLR